MKNKSIFETKACGRCAGSGHYSYCAMYGSTCFGCGGRGWKFTKRGDAALAFYNDLRSKRAIDYKVGDLIYMDFRPMGSAGFCHVLKIETTDKGVTIETAKGTHMNYAPEHKIIAGWSAEEKAPLVNAARVYEAMLGKSGKLAKKFNAEMEVLDG